VLLTIWSIRSRLPFTLFAHLTKPMPATFADGCELPRSSSALAALHRGHYPRPPIEYFYFAAFFPPRCAVLHRREIHLGFETSASRDPALIVETAIAIGNWDWIVFHPCRYGFNAEWTPQLVRQKKRGFRV
jgi:hypothetical protein